MEGRWKGDGRSMVGRWTTHQREGETRRSVRVDGAREGLDGAGPARGRIRHAIRARRDRVEDSKAREAHRKGRDARGAERDDGIVDEGEGEGEEAGKGEEQGVERAAEHTHAQQRQYDQHRCGGAHNGALPTRHEWQLSDGHPGAKTELRGPAKVGSGTGQAADAERAIYVLEATTSLCSAHSAQRRIQCLAGEQRREGVCLWWRGVPRRWGVARGYH